jgi:hypothetical protein
VALSVATLAACLWESPERRGARLSATALLAETRARVPQFRQDTLIREGGGTRIEFHAWFDGPCLAILREQARSGPESWSDYRLYLVRGRLLACTTSMHYAPGEAKFRSLQNAALFDAGGRPVRDAAQRDGQRLAMRARDLVALRRMLEQVAHDVEDDLLARRRAAR